MDLTALTDDELGQLHSDVAAEKHRRDTLSGIPLQIAELAAQYRDGGGDEDALIGALTPEQEAALNT